jgi:hypothetical protein
MTIKFWLEDKPRTIPSYGDVYPAIEVDEFLDMWDCGSGYWCNPELNEMYGRIDGTQPEQATHFIWFNK